MEYVIYADESDKDGQFCSDFYGGALVRSIHLNQIETDLNELKAKLQLNEAKWNKITQVNKDSYKTLISRFFDYIREDKVKFRLMFRQSRDQNHNLTQQQRENSYFLLYYQFLKHSFGLEHHCSLKKPVKIRFYLDQIPNKVEKVRTFKLYISALAKLTNFIGRVSIDVSDIAEVDSKKHVILQCADVILGSMSFKLNKKDESRPHGPRVIPKKTAAKLEVYRHIYKEICSIHPRFNIGVSTGQRENEWPMSLWCHSYRHWQFKPSASVRVNDESYAADQAKSVN